VVAGLAGISKPYLSALERGQRGFNRRGLVEDLAEALGCSVTDLTGQPYYLAVDRQSADAVATIPGVSAALHDTTLDDIPDIPVRPLPELVRAAAQSTPTLMTRATRWPVRAWERYWLSCMCMR